VSTQPSNHNGRLRVGIVGGGTIAEAHVPYVRKAGGEVVGVADVSVVRANALADRFAVQRIYRSLTDLLDVEKPDVVHVLTPPHTHATVACEALERGVHVLVEKPMAVAPAEVDRMVEAAGKGKALLVVDHNRLFDPVMLEARRLLDHGELGELLAVESYQAGRASERPWLAELPGGNLGDLVPHPLYLQLAFIGKVEQLHAYATSPSGGQAPEELRVLMKGERASGVLTISANATPEMNTLKLCGSRMTVEVNLNNMTLVSRRNYDVPKVVGKVLPSFDEAWQLVSRTVTNTVDFLRGKIRYYPGMGTLIERFYDAVRNGTEPPVSLEAGGDVVRVTAEIWDAVAGKSKRGTGTKRKSTTARKSTAKKTADASAAKSGGAGTDGDGKSSKNADANGAAAHGLEA
jgi:predicted dehydrogenase